MEIFHTLYDWARQAIDVVLHMDMYLNMWIGALGPWIYLILFLVIFAETGLVVTPFLPGDSFLFALGALTKTENAYLRLDILIPLLFIAAVLGDAVNYAVGRFIGLKLFQNPNSKIFRREYLEKTQKFYEKHGGKAIVIARFVPIIRTFAPFVAGVAEMKYSAFLFYNVAGGAAWILIFTIAGAIFGNLPAVKQNFHVVIFGIIFVSILPIVWEWWKDRAEKKRASA